MSRPGNTATSGKSILLLAGIIAFLYFARDVCIPFALALTLTFLLTPLVNLLQALRMRRLPAVIIVVVLALGSVLAIGWIVSVQLVTVADNLPAYRFNIDARLAQVHSRQGTAFERAVESVKDVASELSEPQGAPTVSTGKHRAATAARAKNEPQPVQVVQPPANAIQEIQDLMGPLIKPLGMAAVVVVFTVFMLIKREDLRNRLFMLAGMGRLNLVTQAMNDAANRISRYLVLQFVVNACYGFLFALGLYFIGIPSATLWGVILALFRLVPYVGTWGAASLPLFLSMATSSGWHTPLMVFGLFIGLEIAVSNFIEPWLYGSHTGVSALALLVTAIFWTLLWGWAGLVLSTPLTVCAIVLSRYVPQLSFLHVLMGDEAEMSPEAHLYQRLLAMDQKESSVIVTRFLKNHSLVELYDAVMLPALSLAEQDRHTGSLDSVRESFLFLATAELIAELTEHGAQAETDHRQDFSVRAKPVKRPLVVVLAASDQADELAATMLAQLLEQQLYRTLLLSSNLITNEVLGRLAEEPNTIVCISALPPFAFAQARALCQRVREQLPQNRIVVGLWNQAEELNLLRERFGQAAPDAVSTSLSQAIEQVQQWHREEAGELALTSGPVGSNATP